MSKIGVGVGDEFPVNDGNNPNQNTNANTNSGSAGATPPQDDRAEFEEWKRRRDAWRAQREEWRARRDEWKQRRHEWKQQWRENKRAFREEMRAKFGDDFAYGGRRYGRGRFPAPFFAYGLPRVLGIILVVAVVIFAISHIGYILAGLAAIALLWAAYHHFGHDPLDLGPPRDYSRPINNPPPAPTPSVPKPADNNTNNTGNTNT
ncbi:MAG: hypothetical protein ISS15_08090 [Alphaproteobacteria bacterium]|nr:hypothetical protein [Alphaproteobacteria bacterium]MBL6936831.1 hypothetical protein [Alphaproteobacteria bacterium]MBL7097600.1 hypothetical protein [Alphaproteobacteria bacterium]